ncbi:irregular chiasm C-roughest protein-like isoform X2 [Homarus americanus]|uniref:irregular chiasm C-roughest protein-like isoform X2 n=1 Tax=Homarus americanus TaxID=6706 RepID=UPI001C4735C8|nr:irregular chiasm C-roughest protein-like isoform X2 [Homarus americanus]
MWYKSTFSMMEMNLVQIGTRWKETVICVTLLVSVAYAEQRFIQEPENATAKHGENVTLSCKVEDRKGTVQWTKDGFGLGSDEDLPGYSRYRMIVDDNHGVYNLYIQPVLVEDDAVYQCQVGGAEGERHLTSANAKLTVYFPPKDTDDQVYLDKLSPMDTTSGSPVRITCEAGLSTPASSIKWLLNGKESFSSSQINTTKQRQHDSILVAVRSRLDLKPERKHHEANISCQVSHKGLEIPIIRSLVMTVKYPPKVKISVDSAKIKENDDVKFTCEGDGNPGVLRYKWEVNDVVVVGDHSTEYIMNKIQRSSNTARVACIVSNSIGITKAQHTLSVEYAPRFKEEPTDVDEDEDKSVTLTCDVDGNPPPEIVWLHEAEKKVINVGAKLTLTVTPETVGVYHCRAGVTGFPEESRSMTVFMRGAPQVTPVEKQFGLEGDTVHVECDIQSIPRPSEVVWSKNRHTIDPNESRYNILQETTSTGVKNTLVIHDARPEDFGLYNCTAKNGYGSNTNDIKLMRQLCHIDKEMAIKIAFRESLPLVTTLVAIIGGIVFLIVVVVVIVLFKKKGKGYKDPGLEKHSMRSSDRSSIHDSVLKVETRTATGSDLSPSEDDDYSSHDDWEASDTTISNARRNHDRFRYSTGDYSDPMFPVKDNPNNNSGGYVQYVDYTRDYNPPPPISYNRNSIYSTGAPLNNVDPRYSATYGNPYLRVPSSARGGTNIYGSTGGIEFNPLSSGGGSTTTPGGDTGGVPQNLYAGGAAQNLNINNNNLNNMAVSNTSAAYGHIGHNRNNLRSSTNMNNQYIMVPQAESRHGVHGTHI